jgi:hypothetical protein
MMAAVNITGLIVIGLIFAFLRSEGLIAGLGAAAVIGFLVYANERAFRFAHKHPIPALMGGSHLLQFFRDQMSAKDKAIVSEEPPVIAGSTKVIEGSGSSPDA